jgi:hypothetical protein
MIKAAGDAAVVCVCGCGWLWVYGRVCVEMTVLWWSP